MSISFVVSALFCFIPYIFPATFISRHTSPNSCIIVFLTVFYSLRSKVEMWVCHCANALLLVGFSSIKYLDFFHRMISYTSSILWQYSYNLPAWGTSYSCFRSWYAVLYIRLRVFFFLFFFLTLECFFCLHFLMFLG